MNKPSISPSKSKYKQGSFTPKHPDKYVGDLPIIYRSSWEKRVMAYFDETTAVIIWSSEQLVVPYISPVDNKQHRYYVDFLAKMKLRDGSFKTYAIEIKPLRETLPPRKSKNQLRMLTETKTYIVNQAKWAAAKHFCSQRGIEFLVLNEKDLNL
jgi:hypothetical protein